MVKAPAGSETFRNEFGPPAGGGSNADSLPRPRLCSGDDWLSTVWASERYCGLGRLGLIL